MSEGSLFEGTGVRHIELAHEPQHAVATRTDLEGVATIHTFETLRDEAASWAFAGRAGRPTEPSPGPTAL